MAINATDFLNALQEIESQKGISKNTILTTLKEALAKGFRKQLGGDDADVRVEIDPEKGTIDMYHVKKVVDEVEDDFLELSVKEANELDPSKKYAAGDEFVIPASVDDLRKGIAMSVKSILKQKFSEAEKGILFEAFKDKIGTIITGKVEKVDDRGLSVNIGRASVYLPSSQLIGNERFNLGDQIKVYVQSVESGSKGAHIAVTRSSEGFLRCLFNEEIHEIYDGTISIKGIAREAGERSKVAVFSQDPNVDPAGACIGPNGTRIQKVVGQLGNGQVSEKIDIIAYSDNAGLYVMEALKPAHVVGVDIDVETKTATIIVKDDSYSMAIGRKGVNVRLAAKLTGYSIDVVTESEAIEDELVYQSFEELQALDIEERNKAAMLAFQAKAASSNESASVIPGLPEGYVAPLDRKYEDENNDEIEEALQEESDLEEVKAPSEKQEVVEEPSKEEIKEEAQESESESKEVETPKITKVKTTTSIEELEKNLESESSKKKPTSGRKNVKKKSKSSEDEEEGDSKPSTITKISENAARMSIYTEEELREMEEEEQDQDYNDYDDEVDYDEYDDYYDDDK